MSSRSGRSPGSSAISNGQAKVSGHATPSQTESSPSELASARGLASAWSATGHASGNGRGRLAHSPAVPSRLSF